MGRRGVTLVETLAAITILVVVGYAVFASFLGTTKASVKAQSSLNEALLARMILERITDELNSNPARIAQFLGGGGLSGKTVWGQLVSKPNTKLTAPDGTEVLPAETCPFLQGVMADPKVKDAAGASAVPAGAAVAAALADPEEAVRKSFGDYVARIYLSRRSSSNYGGTTMLAEVTTEATVDIYRISQKPASGDWVPSLSISTELLTPVESMSVDGAKTYGQQFPLYDAKESKEKIVAKLMEEVRFSKEPWDTKARNLLASMLLLYRNVRLEQILTKGVIIGGPTKPAPAITPELSTEGLIKRGETVMETTRSPRIRQELADLNIKNAQTVLDAFKSSQQILNEDIIQGHTELAQEIKDEESSPTFTMLREDVGKLQKKLEETIPSLLEQAAISPGGSTTVNLVNTYASALQELRSLREQYSDALKRREGLWLRSQLFRWYMAEPEFVKVQNVLKDYPTRFRDSLKKGLALDVDQQDKQDATGLQKLFAAQDAIEIKQALRLYDPAAAGVPGEDEILAKIRGANPHYSALLSFTDTLKAADPLTLSLPERFPLYTNVARTLAPLQEAIAKRIEKHKKEIDEPIKNIGAMAPNIIKSAIELTQIKRILEDAQVQASLGVKGPERNTIAGLVGQEPADSTLVSDMGPAVKHNLSPIDKGAINPPPDFSNRVKDSVDKVRTRPPAALPPAPMPPVAAPPVPPAPVSSDGTGTSTVAPSTGSSWTPPPPPPKTPRGNATDAVQQKEEQP